MQAQLRMLKSKTGLKQEEKRDVSSFRDAEKQDRFKTVSSSGAVGGRLSG